ncbi:MULTISPECIES: hypothetical protein [unclassified Crossiella]|uniref:hypothetical protein n=2 Tax=Crossiella TaxID=130795 RepID=UPI001FFF54BC|nr:MULTISPECIES: hypothetical protein [unclassified Crossiella]MCK2241622.1 hypothetical protein [Crossiella sp. S99.2]MCK2255506.1 hypothetical protein [Crossiella sp. S99.1]
MRGKRISYAAGVLALAGSLGLAAPAAADPAHPAGLRVWETIQFSGQTELHPAPSTACTTTSFVVRAEFNNTPHTLKFFRSTDCTGHAITIPANDLHSFPTFPARSFRLATG